LLEKAIKIVAWNYEDVCERESRGREREFEWEM